MTITQMLGQSLILTLLGMGVVFTFLIIMIVFMTISSKLIKALKLDKEEAPSLGAAAANGNAQNNAVIAAIAAAVHDKQINS